LVFYENSYIYKFFNNLNNNGVNIISAKVIMPVIINDCDESVESDDIPIILAQFQFGPLLDIIAETHTQYPH
jgi:hypothetical protein